MDLKEIYQLTALAFEKGNITELLLGQGEWKIPYGNRFSSGNKPTDWDRLISYAVVPYCNADSTGVRTSLFQMSFKSLLLESSPVAIWSAFEIYAAYCYAVRSPEKNTLFPSEIKKLLASSIKSNILELKNCREWDGDLFEEGLWSAVSGSDKFLESKFGMGIL